MADSQFRLCIPTAWNLQSDVNVLALMSRRIAARNSEGIVEDSIEIILIGVINL